MPEAIVPAVLRLPGGRAAGQTSGVLYRRTEGDERLRPRPPSHFADYAALLSPFRFKELVSESRAIAAKGLVSALIDNKAGYVSASHWRPRFVGQDADYGARATAEIESALKICNIRGPRFDWRASWRLSTRNFADAGGFFVLLTSWPGTAQPALQFLEAHRIGQREPQAHEIGPDEAFTIITDEAGNSKRVRGAYVGLIIDGGVISTPAGTEVAYRVLGASKEQDQDISARDLIHVAAPKSYSENRPAPDIAPSLLDFLAIELAQTCQLDQHITDSRLTMIEENESGMPTAAQARLSGGPAGRQATPNGTPVEVYERGGTRFVKSGNKLTPHEAARPADQWMNFDHRVASRAAAALRWRVEMLDPTELRGAGTRAFQDQINTLILDDFNAAAPAAARCLRYISAKLTNLGRIEPHPEWMAWEIAPPPWLEVDRISGRIELEEVAAGRVAMSTLHTRDGSTSREVYAQRILGYKLAVDMQKTEKKAGYDVPLDIILGNLGSKETGGSSRSSGGGTGGGTDPQPSPTQGE